jgi:hypothetical protein
MATALNTFKSFASNITTEDSLVYTTPLDSTSIVLLAQATNVGASDANVTVYTSLNGNTELAKDFTIPVGDAASILTGKLVLEPGTSMSAYANANSAIKLTLSVLETR